MYLHAKNQLNPFLFFLDIAKTIQACYFGYFQHVWLWTVKPILWWKTFKNRKLWWLSSSKKSLSLTSFLKYYKDIANLLFWVLWLHLTTPTKSNSTNLQETLMFICKQKINLIPQFFYRYYFPESCNLTGQEHFGK